MQLVQKNLAVKRRKLHGVNPLELFVDVLHRIDSHPATHVEQPAPRDWGAKTQE